jgi:DNA invertase Pin-like site-specific DNA recombinase
MENPQQKFFLYARKSTDEPDRQILSIEAQITELREFAERENLNIVDSFIESQTAKVPGRPIFNEMTKRMKAGEASGILAWHPDRLARNSIDGGQIIYLVDTEKITALKFPTFWFSPTPQGKFMLNIAFGQSKYYIDNLSENVKRGLRQKVRNGEQCGVAITG